MAEPNDPNLTADISAVDPLEAGLAAGFGQAASPTSAGESVLASLRHTYGELRPVMLRDADGESADHVVRPQSDAMPPLSRPATATSFRVRSLAAAWAPCCAAAIRIWAATWRSRCCSRSTDPRLVAAFLEEAQIGGQLQHPGVVPVYDIGRFGDAPSSP